MAEEFQPADAEFDELLDQRQQENLAKRKQIGEAYEISDITDVAIRLEVLVDLVFPKGSMARQQFELAYEKEAGLLIDLALEWQARDAAGEPRRTLGGDEIPNQDDSVDDDGFVKEPDGGPADEEPPEGDPEA